MKRNLFRLVSRGVFPGFQPSGMYNLGGFPPGWPPCPGWFHHAFLYKAGYTRPGSTRTLPRAGLQALAGYTMPHLGWLNHACSRRSLPRAGSTMPWRGRLVPRPITPLWCYTQAVSSACTCKGISSQRMASPLVLTPGGESRLPWWDLSARLPSPGDASARFAPEALSPP